MKAGFEAYLRTCLKAKCLRLANVLATQSVKSFGMSNYFTTQMLGHLERYSGEIRE